MEQIPAWQKLLYKSLPIALAVLLLSATALTVLANRNIDQPALESYVDWQFDGETSLQSAKDALAADLAAVEASRLELEKKLEETQKLLEQVTEINQNTQSVIEKAEQEGANVADAVEDLKSTWSENETLANQRWVMPIKYTQITSYYGYRSHPIAGESRFHYGVDMSAPRGTPILASRSGTVTIASYEADGAGYYVNIDHEDGYATRYLHMDRYIVTPGQYVFAGQVIGYCGSTGASTGAHLHFSVYYNNECVNPAKFINI